MRKLLGATLLGFLLGSCAIVQIDEDLSGLPDGAYVLLYVPKDASKVMDFCQTEMNLPLSHACVMILTTKESQEAAFKGFIQSGSYINCIVVAPPTNSLIMHELTRCATKGENYWNTSKVKLNTISHGVTK